MLPPSIDNEERGVFKSIDGGNTWKKVLYVSPKAGAADLIIDRTNPKILYASTWQVYRKTWKMWGGGPDCFVSRRWLTRACTDESLARRLSPGTFAGALRPIESGVLASL